MLENLKKEFLHPSVEFTPFPFWFWNDCLTEEELNRQMMAFKEKGVDGFVIHPRLGLPEEIGYLTERYFHYVRFAVERASQLHMKVVLYDEAMYPSGSCHGQVVKENPAFASRGLRMSETDRTEEGEEILACVQREGKTWYFFEGPSGGTIRGVHYGEDDGEADAPASADLMNPEAVAAFLRLTHERYYEQLKDYFGNTVIGIFTDEPNILGRCVREGMIAWSGNFLDDFRKQGGREEDLYLLFAGEDTPEARHIKECYEKAVYERMSRAYYKQIGDWCEKHGVAMTGHPEKSTDIGYLQYFTIPCQDIVWRFVAPEEGRAIRGEHSTMGKCSSDSARHRGKRRNGNECFGCCGAPEDPYRFTMEDMKWYLDWLFVRGVNMIFPHAFYYSLRGKRNEERPPEVGMHSGFWEDYHIVSDYIKRMCGLLTGAVNQAKAAVLCRREELSWEIAAPMFENQIEFNYLEEELLPSCRIENGCVVIEQQRYSVVITDGKDTPETQAFLQRLKEGGGCVLYWNADTAVEEIRDAVKQADIFSPPARNLRYSCIRKDGAELLILVNEGEDTITTKVSLSEGHICQIWDAWNGTVRRLDTPVQEMSLSLGRRESMILATDRGVAFSEEVLCV